MTIIIISWDSIDSVLLCFKYPSLLYTLSETRGGFGGKFQTQTEHFITNWEPGNRNFCKYYRETTEMMTDFLNGSWWSIVCKNILIQPFWPTVIERGGVLVRPGTGSVLIELYFVSWYDGGWWWWLVGVSQWVTRRVIRSNSIWSWHSVWHSQSGQGRKYYYCL